MRYGALAPQEISRSPSRAGYLNALCAKKHGTGLKRRGRFRRLRQRRQTQARLRPDQQAVRRRQSIGSAEARNTVGDEVRFRRSAGRALSRPPPRAHLRRQDRHQRQSQRCLREGHLLGNGSFRWTFPVRPETPTRVTTVGRHHGAIIRCPRGGGFQTRAVSAVGLQAAAARWGCCT